MKILFFILKNVFYIIIIVQNSEIKNNIQIKNSKIFLNFHFLFKTKNFKLIKTNINLLNAKT